MVLFVSYRWWMVGCGVLGGMWWVVGGVVVGGGWFRACKCQKVKI